MSDDHVFTEFSRLSRHWSAKTYKNPVEKESNEYISNNHKLETQALMAMYTAK